MNLKDVALKLTRTEKLIAEYVWGVVPTDVDFIRNSKFYQSEFKRLTSHPYEPRIDLENFTITTQVHYTNTVKYNYDRPQEDLVTVMSILINNYRKLVKEHRCIMRKLGLYYGS